MALSKSEVRSFHLLFHLLGLLLLEFFTMLSDEGAAHNKTLCTTCTIRSKATTNIVQSSLLPPLQLGRGF